MKFSATTLMLFLLFIATFSEGAGKKVSEMGNKHNFSFQNTSVNYRASNTDDNPNYPRSSQICVFCHTPHRSSSEGPLWNRKDSTKTFKHFSSSTLAIDDAIMSGVSDYGQPNGSSRLCLSCHDGVTALGAVFTTPGTATSVNIPFIDEKRGLSGPNVTIAYETFSSHHPVSFKYNDAVRAILTSSRYDPLDINQYRYTPTTNEVKLDKLERMQCTTCHNPHQDQSDSPDPANPFWVSKTYAEVCVTCHDISPLPGNP
jgi:predicted CXXCH cytochrome family protein